MTNIEQTLVVLTDEQLAAVCATAEQDPPAGIIQLWAAIGVDLTDPSIAEQSVRPWSYAIPETQWAQVCEALARWDRAHGSMASAMLMLVNVGPSSRDGQ